MIYLAIVLVAGFLIGYVFKRVSKQKLTAVGTVETPGYTENKIDPDHVLITFRPEKHQPVVVEYYYNKSSYQTPQDFRRLNKTVTVKYDPANPMNYTIYEEEKGEKTRVIVALLMGIVFGIIAVDNTDGGWFEKSRSFFITGVIVYAATWLLIKLDAVFSFLNILKKRDEE